MTLEYRQRPSAGEPAGDLFLMHGRGADEHDLFPLLDLLDPQQRLSGFTPGGPLRLPPGGKHWYAVPRVGYPDPATFAEGYGALTSFIDEQHPDWNSTILGGFSQGTVMSYAVALDDRRTLPAGVIALSGFIPTVDNWAMREDLKGFPVVISHGVQDPVISVEFARDARQKLEAAGADVTYHEHPGGHHIDPRFLAGLPAWIERVVP